MAFTYDPLFAVDPANPANVARNSTITIFDPADVAQSPIAIKDPTGSPLPNPITVDAAGMGPAFQHPTLARVGWKGAGFVGYFTSYEGMLSETVAAKEAAQQAATAAANSAATAAVPSETAITSAINGAGAPRVALNSAIANLVGAVFRDTESEALAAAEQYGVTGYWFVSGAPAELTEVTPAAPTFNDAAGTGSDTYTIPTSTGVDYQVGGVTKAPGTYPASGTITVTAVAQAGYKLAGTTSWVRAFSTVDTYVNMVTASGPVHFVPLDDAAGTTSPRKLGSAEPASYTATAVTFGTPIGNLSGATFSGTSSKVMGSALTQALQGKTVGTIEAVVKADSFAATRYIVGQHSGAWSMELAASTGRTIGFGSVLTPNLTPGTAYHLMVVSDGTNKTVYVNGVKGQVAASTMNIVAATTAVAIGAKNGVADPFVGVIAGVAVYDKALTEADALAHAKAAGLA